MLKQKLIVIVATIACCCLIGCSAVPKARITIVDSYTVAQMLYENGGTRSFVRADSPWFGGPDKWKYEDRTVWPTAEVIHNNRKMTIRYTKGGLWSLRRFKDTISINAKETNDTVLSVKCEIKDESHGAPHVVAIILEPIVNLLNPYKRDHERENMLMTSTAQQLKAEHQAHIEWLGKWRPDPNDI